MVHPAKALWQCHKCGRRFVARHQYHTCERHTLAEHFAGKDPAVRQLYDHLVKTVRSFGPVTIYTQKSRILFQARTRFASIVVRRRWLEVTLWLKRRARHPRIRRVEAGALRDYGCVFRLAAQGDLDDDLIQLVREACDVGQGVHPTALRH